MKHIKMRFVLTVLILSTSLILGGCGVDNSNTEPHYTEDITENAVNITLNGNTAECTSPGVTVTDGRVTLMRTGRYVLTGKFNGEILVEADNRAQPVIILDNAQIDNNNGAALNITSAKHVTVITKDASENTLSSTVGLLGKKSDGAVFSKTDLEFAGSGKLTVSSSAGSGIVCKATLLLKEGEYSISASSHGIKAKDCARISGGKVSINATGDGIHCDGEDPYDNTGVYISGGTVNICSNDDAIHSDGRLDISGGTLNVEKSHEGLEAFTIGIYGGTVNINANEDGMNATKSSSSDNNNRQPGSINISGGTLNIKAGDDGIDANGDINISGGTVTVSCPPSGDHDTLDHDGTANITGGCLFATGSAETQTVTLSSFGVISESFDVLPGGTAVTLTDKDGNVILTQTPERDLSYMMISCPQVIVGETYTLTMGDKRITVTAK